LLQSGSLFHERLSPKWLTFILAFTVIQIRVTKEEKKAIIEKAKQMNMNRSKFIRHALLNSELKVWKEGQQFLDELYRLECCLQKIRHITKADAVEVDNKIERLVEDTGRNL